MSKSPINAKLQDAAGELQSCVMCGNRPHDLVEVIGEIPEARPVYRKGICSNVNSALEFRVCGMCLRYADENSVRQLITNAIDHLEWRLMKLRRLRGRLKLPSWSDYDKARDCAEEAREKQ